MIQKYTITVTIIALCGMLASACSSKSPGCTQHKDCPPAQVCEAKVCMRLCTLDAHCGTGEFCNGTSCVSGERGNPVIDSIVGNSSSDCTTSNGTTLPCLGSALRVTGDNLAGSTFVLQSWLPDVPLSPGTVASKKLIELVPSTQIRTDVAYSLVVTNAAGSTTADVTLLKGDKGDQGPPGADGIDGITGTIYRTDNSGSTALPQTSTDRISISMTKQAGTTTFQSVNNDILIQICADEDGCTVEIGVTGYDDGNGVIKAPWMGMPCRMYMRPSGTITGAYDWSVSQHCWLTFERSHNNGSVTSTIPYRPYASGQFGTDGAAQSRVVLDYLNLCMLAESAPTTATTSGAFQPDDTPGFYFITQDTDWRTFTNDPNTRWTGASRTCELSIRD